MKRVWMRAALILLLCAALLTGCSLPGAAPTVSESSSGPVDPLTGETMSRVGRRPAAVVIDNAPDDTTQWGISQTSVMIEALTVSGLPTSLCLAYSSVEDMPRVGPVAAGQDLFWRLLAAQQILPVQRGSGVYDRNYLDYYGLHAVDAREVGRKAFSCAEEWSSAPLWYTSGAAVASVAGSLNISSELSMAGANALTAYTAEGEEIVAVPAFLPFQNGGRSAEPSASDAVTVQIQFSLQSTTRFAYDAGSGVYQMLHADGTPQLDANNGQQASFDNVLILFSASSLRDDGSTLDYDLSMGGGVWLYGGQLWDITWRQGTDSTFAFYGQDGKPLSIQPGRSYLALLSSITGQELSVYDSEGKNLTMAG